MTEKRQYICHLLTDVILNIKSASEGNNSTLDFIPGNCFLGIVARTIYPSGDDNLCALLFHSGMVRFSDAHPLRNGVRSVRIPALFYKPKLNTEGGDMYVYPQVDPTKQSIRELQLKQCRSGFFVFDSNANSMEECKQERNFAIKSAYDKERLCSKDECMFGYESLQGGTDFAFDIEIDDCVPERDKIWKQIEEALCGNRSIGRSRTAQYGRVKIDPKAYQEQARSCCLQKDEVWVYADARLVFLDEYGLPTFRPTAETLGISGGKIVWEKSQVRTFQYAPWNAKRRAFDMDRCGIEKGSVFVVEVGAAADSMPSTNYVGCYRNEGFGRVLYNPAFLQSKDGKSIFSKVEPREAKEQDRKPVSALNQTPLIKYLKGQEQKQMNSRRIYEQVNAFRQNYGNRFVGETFASQWGSIRALAMQCQSYEEIWDSLFGEKEVNGHKKGYLVHGVAKDKWEHSGRKKCLQDFLEQNPRDISVELLINLASEMQKIKK